MAKQRDILPQVLERVRQDAPDCAIGLSGSVRYGYERPDSDIDLLVAVPDFRAREFQGAKLSHETDEARVANFFVGDIRVEVVYFDFAYLDHVQQSPWRSYTLSQAEILHDPEKRFTRCQVALREWFHAHPDITSVWEKQLQMCREYALTDKPSRRTRWFLYGAQTGTHRDCAEAGEISNTVRTLGVRSPRPPTTRTFGRGFGYQQ